MNKAYKVIFNKARGVLMVANELTSSVQAKGTKTVVAAAVTALVAGVAVAADNDFSPTGSDTQVVYKDFDTTTADDPNKTFDGVLNMTITGTKTRSTGLVASGKDATYTNKGTINVNLAENNATNFWQVKGMMAKDNSEAVNDGTINVKNAYGMTIGTAGKNTITNNGTINVSGKGAAMEVAPTGIAGSGTTAGSNGQAINNGTIIADNKNNNDKTAYGVILGGQGNTFTNNGTLDATDGTAILVHADGTTDANTVIFGEKSTTKGQVYVGADVTNTNIEFKKGAKFDGTIVVSANSGTKLTATGLTFEGKQNAIKFEGGSSIDLTDVNFTKNTAESGGALFIKGVNSVKFNDVVFTGNSAQAQGGAILAGSSTGSNGNDQGSSDLIFNITKDLTYSGNTVSSADDAAGGFLFLDRGANAAFNVAEGKTLTIGASVTTDDTDSIASFTPTANGGKHALVKKEGAGDLVINSNLDKYYGTVQVNGGTMTVNSDWKIKNEVTVGSGATLALATFDTIAADKSNNYDVDGNAIGGSISVNGGTLQTSSDQIFKTALNEEGTTADAEGLQGKNVTFNDGTLALTDKLYNLNYAKTAGDLLTNGKVVMLGELINQNADVALKDLDGIGENVELSNLTVKEENKNIQIGGSDPADSNTAYRAESLSVGAIDLGDKTTVTIDGDKTLTLAGNNDKIVKSTAEGGATVKVASGTLALGGTVSKGGTLDSVELASAGQMTAVGDAIFTLEKLEGEGKVVVGTDNRAGNVVLNDITGFTGMIFADPDTAATPSEASSVSVNVGTQPVSAFLVAGLNSVVTTDATKDDGVSAFNKIAAAQGLSWGSDVKSIFYVGNTLNLGTTGSVLVDSTATQTATRTNATATVAKNGMLIVNQNAGDTIVTGNVVLQDGSYLGVVNAAVGEFALASGDVTDNGTTVATDNPFIKGAISGKNVVNTLDAESGLGAVASTGIHAMARRADFIMTETVANRTSLDQPRQPGVNLWVDVTGERYKADSFNNNGSFRADAGYATFGGDIEVLNGLTAGLALQYGDASLRSDVSGIKNDITSYGLTAYAGKTFGAAKVVGELAWLKSENDITAQQSALNQDLDVNIYSAGVRAQYELTAGSFKFVPGIGLRVSHLKADDMNIGSIKVDDMNLTYVQMPISMRITGFEANASGWSVAPSLKVAYVPTFGDKDIKAYGYSQDVLDMSPVQADFGLRAANGNLMFNVDMMVGGGESGTSSIGGKVGVKYAF